MVIDKLPALSTELVKQLDTAFPPECIKPTESLEMAHRRAGKRELIDFLLTLVKRGEQSDIP